MHQTCERYEIFDNSRIAIVIVDSDRIVTFANQGAQDLLANKVDIGRQLGVHLPWSITVSNTS